MPHRVRDAVRCSIQPRRPAIKVNKWFRLPLAFYRGYLAAAAAAPFRNAAEGRGSGHGDTAVDSHVQRNELANQHLQWRAAGGLFYPDLGHRCLQDHGFADPEPLRAAQYFACAVPERSSATGGADHGPLRVVARAEQADRG